MADQLIAWPLRALDRNADIVASAKCYVYQTGTQTPVVVEDEDGAPLPWPVLADANGVFPQMFNPGSGVLKVTVTTSGGVILPGYPLDPAPISRADDSAAVDVSFTPSTDLPVTNVQAAINNLMAQVKTLQRSRVGTIFAHGYAAPPAKAFECKGQNVSRTTWPDLFAVVGTTFGAGDGSTTFGLPDLRGEFIRGYDNGRGVDGTRVFGSSQAAAMLNHSHPITVAPGGGHSHAANVNGGAGASTVLQTVSALSVASTGYIASESDHTHTATAGNPSVGGGTETRPRNIALMFCIWAE